MSALELRAALSLSSIFALRMLGLFIILPVFAIHARTLPGADAVMLWAVPAAPSLPAPPAGAALRRPSLVGILLMPQLLRLNLGIFVLHSVLMAIFVVVPIALLEFGGMPVGTHWKVYLPAVLLSFMAMVSPIIWAERRGRNRTVLLASVALMGLAVLALIPAMVSPVWIAFLLFLYFAAFNILEAQLPALVSRIAPPAGKGAALGVYNTTQALGLAAGGVVGGMLVKYTVLQAVFVFGAAMMLLWFIAAFSMREPEKRQPANAISLEGDFKHGLSQ